MSERKLRIWNGRGYIVRDPNHDPRWKNTRTGSVYIAAYSRADAAKVMAEYLGRMPQGADYEIKTFFHEGAWGNSMEGIQPERGMWIQFSDNYPRETPVRVV